MDELNNTTIAEASIPDAILGHKTLKLIVLVDNLEFVKRAGYKAMAVIAGIKREVVWIKNPNIQTVKLQIPDLPEGVNVFSISTKNLFAYSISSDMLTGKDADAAFVEAGLPIYN